MGQSKHGDRSHNPPQQQQRREERKETPVEDSGIFAKVKGFFGNISLPENPLNKLPRPSMPSLEGKLGKPEFLGKIPMRQSFILWGIFLIGMIALSLAPRAFEGMGVARNWLTTEMFRLVGFEFSRPQTLSLMISGIRFYIPFLVWMGLLVFLLITLKKEREEAKEFEDFVAVLVTVIFFGMFAAFPNQMSAMITQALGWVSNEAAAVIDPQWMLVIFGFIAVSVGAVFSIRGEDDLTAFAASSTSIAALLRMAYPQNGFVYVFLAMGVIAFVFEVRRETKKTKGRESVLFVVLVMIIVGIVVYIAVLNTITASMFATLTPPTWFDGFGNFVFYHAQIIAIVAAGLAAWQTKFVLSRLLVTVIVRDPNKRTALLPNGATRIYDIQALFTASLMVLALFRVV